MIDLKDLENVEVLDLNEEQRREVSGGQYLTNTGGHIGKQGTKSTLMDAIYHFAWEAYYQY